MTEKVRDEFIKRRVPAKIFHDHRAKLYGARGMNAEHLRMMVLIEILKELQFLNDK